MNGEQHQEILRTEGLSKFFPGVKALDNVNFSLRRGEIMALLGENGAGKSTLIKALTGVYHADRGAIWLEGREISPKNTAHAQQLGIGTVYQEVNLLPNMSVADNLFIGRSQPRCGRLVAANKMRLPNVLFVNSVFVPPALNSRSNFSPAVISRRCCSPAGC